MISIRDYSISDYINVKELLQKANMFDEARDSYENLERKINTNPGSILVAIDSEKIIGNVYLVQDGWASFIFRLVVDEEYRKKGIGSMLLERAEQRLKERGAKEVSLFFRASNINLLEFYAHRSYEPASCLHQAMHKEL
ncbi:MAG: GNAT family N-acetyltransferase [Nanoarchaeota archaeon]|mgnify:CR=1 FL=1